MPRPGKESISRADLQVLVFPECALDQMNQKRREPIVPRFSVQEPRAVVPQFAESFIGQLNVNGEIWCLILGICDA